jgi:ribosomal 30S subunit maturation factor RimM
MIVENFTLDGKPIPSAEGVAARNTIIHINPKILAYTPRVDQYFYLDFMRYTVVGVSNDMGVLKIILRANGARP